MRAEQDCDVPLVAEPPNEVYGNLLVMRIETDQRLVEKQQPRRTDQCLGEQQPLPFAPGHLAERALREIPRTHCRKRLLDTAAVCGA